MDTLTPDDGSMAILSKAAQASVNANAGVPADVDAKRDQGSVAQSEPSQPADACTVHIDSVRKALSCQLCHELLAASLVMHCSHVFCGNCLFEHLNVKPQCPTCQVNMRAIPVRCLALDNVAAAFVAASGEETSKAKHEARTEDGKAAANKINKMFWWLQSNVPGPNYGDQSIPGALPGAIPGQARHTVGGAGPGLPLGQHSILGSQGSLNGLASQFGGLAGHNNRAPSPQMSYNASPAHTPYGSYDGSLPPAHHRRCSDPNLPRGGRRSTSNSVAAGPAPVAARHHSYPQAAGYNAQLPPMAAHAMAPAGAAFGGLDTLGLHHHLAAGGLQHPQAAVPGLQCPPTPHQTAQYNAALGLGGADYAAAAAAAAATSLPGLPPADPMHVLQMLQQMSMSGAWTNQ